MVHTLNWIFPSRLCDGIAQSANYRAAPVNLKFGFSAGGLNYARFLRYSKDCTGYLCQKVLLQYWPMLAPRSEPGSQEVNSNVAGNLCFRARQSARNQKMILVKL